MSLFDQVWLRAGALAAGGWLALATGSSCGGNGFVCSADGQCKLADLQGRCEATHYCSFPTDQCQSGQRYGKHAPPSLAGTCVPTGGGSGSGGTTTTGVADGSASGLVTSLTGFTTTSPGSFTGGFTTTTTSGPGTTAGSTCGNGQLDPGEQCDGPGTLGGQTCADFGYQQGTVTCWKCHFDTSNCSTCGDGQVSGPEACDGQSFAGDTCQAEGFDGGTLGCSAMCDAVITDGCYGCGDGNIDPGEVCDGTALATSSCHDIGWYAGTLTCSDDCRGFDTSGCSGLQCGGQPHDTIGPCPDVCSSCTTTACIIDCGGNSACAGDDITCPGGWDCEVQCNGDSACAGATVSCPPHYDCRLTCQGTSGCANASLQCSDDGTCRIDCTAGDTAVCSGADVQCGSDQCRAMCANSAASNPSLTCGNACLCATC